MRPKERRDSRQADLLRSRLDAIIDMGHPPGDAFADDRLVVPRGAVWGGLRGQPGRPSLPTRTKTEAIKPSDLNRVIVDTTVQPKNVMFPTDARLLNRAREILVRLAKRQGLALRQSYARVGKFALIKHQRYAHAKQFKRARQALKKLRTYLGRTIRDIALKIEGRIDLLGGIVLGRMLALARRVLDQKQHRKRLAGALASGSV